MAISLIIWIFPGNSWLILISFSRILIALSGRPFIHFASYWHTHWHAEFLKSSVRVQLKNNNLFVTSKTNSPSYESKVFHKGQRAFLRPHLMVYYSLFITLTSLIKGHVCLFFSRKKSSLPSDFHVIDWKFHPTR